LNKKANFTAVIIGLFVTGILAVIFFTSAIVPQVKDSTNLMNFTESVTKVGAVGAYMTANLTHYPIASGSIGITGLTLTNNYTIIDYNDGTINFTNTAAAAYDVYYLYEGSSYLDTPAERALFGVVIIAVMIGIAYFLFKGFNLTD